MDNQSHNSDPLTWRDESPPLDDDYIRRELQISIDQVARGEVSDLDMGALLAEAHRRYAARQAARKEH
jgi:hypothetical protein